MSQIAQALPARTMLQSYLTTPLYARKQEAITFHDESRNLSAYIWPPRSPGVGGYQLSTYIGRNNATRENLTLVDALTLAAEFFLPDMESAQ